MTRSRVIGAETVMGASQRGLLSIEIAKGDVVTALARETADRLGLKLVNEPFELPVPPRANGATSMRRGLYRRSPGWLSPSRRARKSRRLGRVALVGVGGVGANVAHLAALSDLAECLALVDTVPGLAAAIALDIEHASGITGARVRCLGGDRSDLLSGAEIVVVTAGRARRPGMNRSDLIAVNSRVVRQVGEAIRVEAPDAIVIVVTNPLDEMVVEMLQATRFPRERVLGMAGTLDSCRFRHALARAAGACPADVEAVALGSHGAEMAPIASRATIRDMPLCKFLSESEISACAQAAIDGGGDVVTLKKTGSAVVAPAHAVIELIDHVRGARAGPVPVSVMLKGEYGIDGVVLGVPAHLGQAGLVQVAEMSISDSERAMLRSAADAIQERLGL